MTDQANPAVPAGETVEAPVKGSQEYVQQMAAKYENQGQAVGSPASIPLKPEGGHDKFYDAKTGAYNWDAHKQEQAWQQQQKQANTADSFIDTPAEVPEVKIGEGLDQYARAVAAGDRAASQKIAQSLLTAGVTRVTLEMQFNSVRNLQASKRAEVIGYAGGEQAAEAMKVWVANNLQPEEADQYRAALGGDNWKMAIDSLKSRMGTTPAINMDGGSGPDGSAAGFASIQEQTAAMRDPRYRKDPAYRAQVISRVAASPSF